MEPYYVIFQRADRKFDVGKVEWHTEVRPVLGKEFKTREEAQIVLNLIHEIGLKKVQEMFENATFEV